MKNLLLIVVTASFFGLVGGMPARAQVVDTIVADIPFGFTVRDTTLPAGEYYIKRIDSVDPGVMQISSADGAERLAFLVGSAQSVKRPDQTKLVFDRVGDQYFLSEIFEEGNSAGVELKRPSAELQLEKDGAMSQLHSVVVPAHSGVKAQR
jgi:hypothetical protein